MFINAVTVEKDGEQSIEILNSIVPCPRELLDTVSGFHTDLEKREAHEAQQAANIEKYGHADWYSWCNANWGTKWGDYDTALIDVGGYMSDPDVMHASFAFTSAWAPPVAGLAMVSAVFPTLWFVMTYDEPGMAFFGCATIANGEVLADECREYSFPPSDEEEEEEEEEDCLEEMERISDMVGDATDEIEQRQMRALVPEKFHGARF